MTEGGFIGEPVVAGEREPIPESERPERVGLTASDFRRMAFVAEADPLFFQEQAGEVPEGTWLAKRQEIRDRFPS